MVCAVIKVSWRLVPSGGTSSTGEQILVADAEGGICGSCFSLTSGITLSCAHVFSGAFTPASGFDRCSVFIVQKSGLWAEVRRSDVMMHRRYDACIISRFMSEYPYPVSKARPEEVTACRLEGYEGGKGPVSFTLVGEPFPALAVATSNIASVSQNVSSTTVKSAILDIRSYDLRIRNKPGFIVDVQGKKGLSGGPMINEDDSGVVGLNFMGIPPGDPNKTAIGVLDIREFPFL